MPPREDAALEPAMLGDLPATRGLNQLSDAERQQLATSNQPAQVGRYRLLDKLGEGGFGTVYLADDPQLQRRVAIKVPRSDKKWKPEQLEEYRREAQVLAKFEHENIVRVYDIGQDDLFPVFIVSQFIDGISLSKIVHGFHKDKKYRYVARVIQILAMSLKYAHEQGVVHRDLKPANVMLRHGDFQVFLMDFGLALRDEDNAAGQVCGTPGYASPEQVSGEGHRIDGRSDLYSLGAMLHEMLTGRVPFATKPEHQGDGWAAWTSYRERVRHSDVRPPRQLDQNIPRELERICLKLLERRASDRYSCAADLIEDLTAYIAGVPLTMVGGSDAESVQSVASAVGVALGTAGSGDPRRALGAGLPTTPPSRPQVSPTAGASPTPGAADTPGTPALTPTPTPPLSDEPVLRIVPKGLRSFDKEDQDFFVDLLPGTRDRDGLPQSIRFWKTRIEATDSENTFSIGVLYGPSGCGKSSLMKAGLLPRLSDRILVVDLEATGSSEPRPSGSGLQSGHARTTPLLDGRGSDGRGPATNSTENAIRTRIAKLCDLSAESSKTLESTLRAVRQGHGVPSRGKVLLVIDQFEQWLHANRDHDWTELAYALRQCDGVHLQCLLLVRDDFWLAIERFLKQLEVRLRDGENCEAADLFDLPHAKRVLGAFGVAYAALPPRPQDWSAEQREFLEQSVAGLAQENRIISVRLALFAAMVKSRPWTPATLTAIGGVSGVGVTFLEETFSASTAKAAYRAHERAVRGVLKLLLPDTGTDIKGHRVSRDELLTASGYARTPDKFQSLLEILDLDLRLITPVDAKEEESGSQGDGEISNPKSQISNPKLFYQLAHDYLVPSIREWLTKKQRETWRGRAQLRLDERTAQWNRQPQSRYLPSLFEYTSIVCCVPRRKRSTEQRRLMRRASRHHLLRWGSLLLLIAATLIGVERHLTERQRVADDKTATTRVSVLANATADGVPFAIEPLIGLRELAIPKLRALMLKTSASWRDRSHAGCALAKLGDTPSSDAIVITILDAVPTAANDEAKNMVVALRDLANSGEITTRSRTRESSDADARSFTTSATTGLREITARIAERVMAIELTDEAKRSERMTLKVRYAALALYLGDPSLVSPMLQLGLDPTERTAFMLRLKDWPAITPELRDLMATTTDEALRSGVVAAIGHFPKPANPDHDELVAVLKDLFVNAPDGGSHGAIDWTLRKWSVELPDVSDHTATGLAPMVPALLRGPEAEPNQVAQTLGNHPDKRDGGASQPHRWYTNTVGMTFVEIPAGKHSLGNKPNESPPVELTHAVYLSNRELTVAQFRAFVADTSTPEDQKPKKGSDGWDRWSKSVSPTDECPVQTISWLDSAMYCNWLSRKHPFQGLCFGCFWVIC